MAEHKFPKFTKEEQREIKMEVKKIMNENKKLNEGIEEDERAVALANYLGVEVEDVEDNGDNEYTINGETYKVLTNSEADDATYNDIENSIDDLGLEAFTPNFQDWIVENALSPTDWFDDAQKESAEYYIEDIETESDSEFENRLLSELVENDILSTDNFHENEDGILVLNDDVDLDTAKEQFVNKMCEEDAFEWYKFNFGDESLRDLIKEGRINLDIQAIVDEAISLDGRGHFISYYDGTEHELENDFYAYRTN